MAQSEALSRIGTFEVVHTDQRRTISEFNAPHFSIQHFQVHATSLPLGNHYHKKKSETFVVLEGGGEVVLSKISADGSAEPFVVQKLQKDSVVHVAPHVAHTFVLWPGSKMICFSSAPYDPENPDMHPRQLVVPTL